MPMSKSIMALVKLSYRQVIPEERKLLVFGLTLFYFGPNLKQGIKLYFVLLIWCFIFRQNTLQKLDKGMIVWEHVEL